MLGEFLDRMFGEDAEATANNTTANQVLINSPEKQKEKDPGLFPSLFSQLVSATFLLRLLLRSAPEQSSRQQPL